MIQGKGTTKNPRKITLKACLITVVAGIATLTTASQLDFKPTVLINEGESVSVQQLEFRSLDKNLVGNLYLPASFDENESYPTIVYSGPMTQIKEQTGAVYGEKMAEKGYIFLAFDHLGYGESEGEPRNHENSFIKMENIRDAISHLRSLPYVDRSRFYGLGICASGPLMAQVATTDKRMKAIATVSGMMNNSAMLTMMPKEQVIAMMNNANEARQRAYESGTVEYIDAMGLERLDPETLDQDGVYYGAYDFYMTDRGGASTYPRYSHKAPASWLEGATANNAMSIAPVLYTPYLGIYGEKALRDTGPLTQQFFEACSEPKEILEVAGANHLSLYDDDQYVDQAVTRIDEFFKKHSGQ